MNRGDDSRESEGFRVLLGAVAAFILGTALIGIATAKSVRANGWGQNQWAPSALPWFWAGIATAVISLGLFVASLTSG